MTLQEIESQIEACRNLTHKTMGNKIDDDGIANMIGGVPAAVEGLYDAWSTLRRQLWSPSYQAWANQLKDRCRESLMALSAEHKLMYFGEPDRWPADHKNPAVH